jgi:hypothetical protein
MNSTDARELMYFMYPYIITCTVLTFFCHWNPAKLVPS